MSAEPITDELLTAYVDGELPAEERSRVNQALATDPASAGERHRPQDEVLGLPNDDARRSGTVHRDVDRIEAPLDRALADMHTAAVHHDDEPLVQGGLGVGREIRRARLVGNDDATGAIESDGRVGLASVEATTVRVEERPPVGAGDRDAIARREDERSTEGRTDARAWLSSRRTERHAPLLLRAALR